MLYIRYVPVSVRCHPPWLTAINHSQPPWTTRNTLIFSHQQFWTTIHHHELTMVHHQPLVNSPTASTWNHVSAKPASMRHSPGCERVTTTKQSTARQIMAVKQPRVHGWWRVGYGWDPRWVYDCSAARLCRLRLIAGLFAAFALHLTCGWFQRVPTGSKVFLVMALIMNQCQLWWIRWCTKLHEFSKLEHTVCKQCTALFGKRLEAKKTRV